MSREGVGLVVVVLMLAAGLRYVVQKKVCHLKGLSLVGGTRRPKCRRGRRVGCGVSRGCIKNSD